MVAAVIVGVDARAAAEVPAGRGRYVRELLRALARRPDDGTRYVLYCRTPAELDLDARFRWRPLPAPDPLWHLLAAARASRACDVFLSTNSYLTAWFTTIPTALVMFDLIAFLPEALPQGRAARIERATLRPALRRAALALCISEATRRDLVERFPDVEARALVTPLAASPPAVPADLDEVRARHGLARPFVLGVGTLEPRKNLVALIDAWAGLGTDAELVLVGPPGWEMEEIVRRARAAHVRLLGFVSDADLAALYAMCELFCYPSLYEGFGLPVLEAMAGGAPVVCANTSSLPEVAGDAAVLVDPRDPQALRAALAALLGDPGERARLREAGRRRAAEFSWERTAAATLGALEGLHRVG
jgi:glycosyltransferase involved in cell wall biosynthesis